MRDIWVKISYFWFIFMLFVVGLLSGNLYVKAAATQSWASSQSRYRYDDHGTNTYSSWETTPHTWSPTLPVNKMQWRVKATNGLSYENTYLIKFAYKPVPQAISPTRIQIYADTGTVEYEEINCGQWKYNDDDFNVVQCTFTPRNNISSSTWLIIEVNFTEAYLTSIRSYMNKYEERTGTNAVITQTGDQITNEIDNATTEITNIITETNQNLINSITEQNQVCEMIDKNKIVNNGWLANDGTITGTQYQTHGVTDYIKITQNTKIKMLINANVGSHRLCFYTINKEYISCIGSADLTPNSLITIPNNASYVRFTIVKSENKPQYEICKNGNQAMTDTLTDDSVDNPGGMLSDMEDLLPNNGVITQLIALPISLYQKVLNSINGTCSSYNLGSLYGTNLILPCIDISDYLGSTVWSSIDLIISGMFVWFIARKMVKAFEGFTSMKDGDVIND